MGMREEEFLQMLRATFKVEAGEHLQTISAGLLEIEKNAAPEEQKKIVESIFRAAHSLKGAARAVNFGEVEAICQSLEDVFAGWKRRLSDLTAAALDSAHRALDAISASLNAPGGSTAAPAPIVPQPAEKIAPVTSVPATPPSPAPAPPPAAAIAVSSVDSETVRVSVSALDARLLEAEEMLAAKLALAQRAADLDALATRFEDWYKEWNKVQPQARALHQILAHTDGATAANVGALTDFVEWNHNYLRTLDSKVTQLRRAAQQDHLAIGKLVDDLMEDSKKLLMLPLSTLGALFPKLVRDLSRTQGKEVDLVIRGDEVRIDKRILEEMKDPLIHLLRNAIDHGVETPQRRREAAKPPRATITLTVTALDGNQVELCVADDGAGIDPATVKEAAIKHGRITSEQAEAFGEDAALELIFEADVSTSPIITEVSGRGLGLAIVREHTEKLGGRLSVESRRGLGTTFRMVLPQTLATFRGVLLRSADRLFVVPTSQVHRVIRFSPQDVETVEGRETITLDGQALALADLAQVLQLPPSAPVRATTGTPAIVLGGPEQRVAFAVDAVLDEREVLVKRLSKPLIRVRNVAGATVLGSGEVTPILNVTDLLKSARTVGTARRVQATPAADIVTKHVLVVEDSITSRMLIKGVLESAGYEVKTAVDGIDGFTTLRAGRFDGVISDVEMPRLNGFDLTARIRADATLKDMPVILVTALESREDRERGIDVGANAYLVKSSFDQSNLLEALRRLV